MENTNIQETTQEIEEEVVCVKIELTEEQYNQLIELQRKYEELLAKQGK